MRIDPKFCAAEKRSPSSSVISDGLDYHFSETELLEIARLLRKNQSFLPDSLSDFSRTVEKRIYDSLSVSEVTKLFS